MNSAIISASSRMEPACFGFSFFGYPPSFFSILASISGKTSRNAISARQGAEHPLLGTTAPSIAQNGYRAFSLGLRPHKDNRPNVHHCSVRERLRSTPGDHTQSLPRLSVGGRGSIRAHCVSENQRKPVILTALSLQTVKHVKPDVGGLLMGPDPKLHAQIVSRLG